MTTGNAPVLLAKRTSISMVINCCTAAMDLNVAVHYEYEENTQPSCYYHPTPRKPHTTLLSSHATHGNYQSRLGIKMRTPGRTDCVEMTYINNLTNFRLNCTPNNLLNIDPSNKERSCSGFISRTVAMANMVRTSILISGDWSPHAHNFICKHVF